MAGICAPASFAAGSPAGTQIPNSATLPYSVAGGAETAVTAVAPVVVVAEVINLVLTWQDGTTGGGEFPGRRQGAELCADQHRQRFPDVPAGR